MSSCILAGQMLCIYGKLHASDSIQGVHGWGHLHKLFWKTNHGTTVLLGSDLSSSRYSEPIGPAAQSKGFTHKNRNQATFALDLHTLLAMECRGGLFA